VQIVVLLGDHAELCVCDLEHTLGITQSKTSHHLRTLANARLRDILASTGAALDPDAVSGLQE